MNEVNVEITVERVGEPDIPIFEIEVTDEDSSWQETYGSKELAEAFLTGLKAGSTFGTFQLTIPDSTEEALAFADRSR